MIETTHEHPWWVVGKGWKTANNLKVDDEFLTSDNRKVLLERIVDEDRFVTVYNLEVEADPFFVDEGSQSLQRIREKDRWIDGHR